MPRTRLRHRPIQRYVDRQDRDHEQSRRETALAREWERVNQQGSSEILEALFEPSELRAPLDDHDAMFAATLIQWLGTNVGYAFLYRAMEAAGYTILRTEEVQRLRDGQWSVRQPTQTGWAMDHQARRHSMTIVNGTPATVARRMVEEMMADALHYGVLTGADPGSAMPTTMTVGAGVPFTIPLLAEDAHGDMRLRHAHGEGTADGSLPPVRFTEDEPRPRQGEQIEWRVDGPEMRAMSGEVRYGEVRETSVRYRHSGMWEPARTRITHGSVLYDLAKVWITAAIHRMGRERGMAGADALPNGCTIYLPADIVVELAHAYGDPRRVLETYYSRDLVDQMLRLYDRHMQAYGEPRTQTFDPPLRDRQPRVQARSQHFNAGPGPGDADDDDPFGEEA